MTSKKNQCECGKEKCLCDVGHNLNITSLCHGHPSPSQLDPLAELKKEANRLIKADGRSVDIVITEDLLSRAFHFGEVSGAKRCSERLKTEKNSGGKADYENGLIQGHRMAEDTVAALIAELEGKGK